MNIPPITVTVSSFFQSAERLATLDKEARSWIGTPFAPHAMIKRAGVDCVHLVAGIYLATGVLKSFAPPPYALDEGSHQRDAKLVGWFKDRQEFVEVTDRLPGDTICFKLHSHISFHSGMMLSSSDFIHVLPKRFVIVSNFRESLYARHVVAVFRPQEAAT